MKKLIIIIFIFLSPIIYSQSIDSRYTINVTSLDYELINIQSNSFEYYQFWLLKRNSSTNYITLIEIIEFNQREINFNFIAYPETNVYYYVKVVAINDGYVLNAVYNIKSYTY